MGITAKIVLPFTLLFGAVIAASSWAAVHQATRGVEHRLERMTSDLAAISAEGGFLLSGPFLLRIQSVFRAHATAVEGEPPRIEATTFPDAELDAAALVVRSALAPSGLRDPVLVGGANYVMTWSPVKGHEAGPARKLILFFPAREITDEKLGVALPLIAAGLIGAVLVTILGYGIARSITQPIRLLAAKTREIAAGALERPIDLHTNDELAKLARAFESMALALRAREAELLRAEQLATLGKITTRIAHEIRNPLAAMKLTVQMLLKEESRPQAREDLERIVAETDRLQLTVDELLGAASPVELQPLPCDLNAVIADTFALLQKQIAHRGVRLETDLGELMPLPLDRNRIKQVLLNLTLNALDAMPGGGILRVRTFADAGVAVVELSDSGPGLPPELAEKAFEPFVTTRPGGTGLGLPLSRTIVEKHGGTLRYSRRGERTVFEVRFPKPPEHG